MFENILFIKKHKGSIAKAVFYGYFIRFTDNNDDKCRQILKKLNKKCWEQLDYSFPDETYFLSTNDHFPTFKYFIDLLRFCIYLDSLLQDDINIF